MMPLTSEVAKSQPAEVRKKPTERQSENEREKGIEREKGRESERESCRDSVRLYPFLCQPCLLFLLATYVIYWHFEHLPCVLPFPLPPTLGLAKISINQSHFIWLHNL